MSINFPSNPTTGDEFSSSACLYTYDGTKWTVTATLLGQGYQSSGIRIPSGTTATRPGSPTTGTFRFNATLSEFEGYDGSSWGSIGGSSIIVLDGGNFANGTSTVPTSSTVDGCSF